MLLEGTPLQTRPGKRALAVPLALTGFELRESDCGQTPMKVKGALSL